jgi:oxygen-independent coproporphyrinogen III oxidase
VNKDAAGLYLHIPFCRGKCPYCHFYSVSDLSRLPAYLDALKKEMAGCRAFPSVPDIIPPESGPDVPTPADEAQNTERIVFDSIYIGGGTPSLLDAADLAGLMEAAARCFSITPDAEITVEANPADRNINWFRQLRQMGVNRIQLGVQSFDDAMLAFLGRRHSADDARAAVEMAAAAGFDNVGLDLIYGLPGQSLPAWRKTLRQATGFRPAHLSCYELSVEEGTPLAERLRAGDFSLPGESRQWRFFQTTSETLSAAGYVHYEISNFAREDRFIARHNRKYWSHGPYLGLGPSAHSYAGGARWWNSALLGDYIEALKNGRSPVAGGERLTRRQGLLEALFLQLRLREGIDLDQFRTEHECDLLEERKAMLNRLIGKGFLQIRNHRLQTTLKGFAVADRLALTLAEGINP